MRLNVSEIFRSIQGEGIHTGVPALFVRLARCNLACSWCDTPYTWDFERFEYATEVKPWPVEELAARVLADSPGHVVVTGGEPLLQHRAIRTLLQKVDSVRDELHEPRDFVEVETNGTVPPPAELFERIDQWNVSPKLASSGEPRRRRIRRGALERLLETGRAHLKLVVSSEQDLREADALLAELGVPPNRVLFMPQATTRQALEARGPWVAEQALVRGVRYSSRLHVQLYGDRRGV